MNIGIIGCGGIADRRTIPEIIKSPNIKLVAIQDIQYSIVKNVAQKFNISSYYTNEEDLLKNKDIEAVYIATPLYAHGLQLINAANHNKHVLCEKPLAFTIKETEEIINYFIKKDLTLQVGFMMRYHGYHIKAKEMLNHGELGQSVMGRAQLTCWYPPIKNAWRQDSQKGGGGALMDMAIHTVDLLRYFFGEVKAVTSFNGTQTHRYKVEDSGVILLLFENGAYGICDSFFNIPDEASKGILEIYGTKGSLISEGTISQVAGGKMFAYLSRFEKSYDAKQNRDSLKKIEITAPLKQMYRAEFEDFVNAIENEKKPMNSGEEALQDFKIIQAAYESQRKNKVIRLY